LKWRWHLAVEEKRRSVDALRFTFALARIGEQTQSQTQQSFLLTDAASVRLLNEAVLTDALRCVRGATLL
jgi:hypothetical protein